MRMGCAGRGMEGCGCAARPERNADRCEGCGMEGCGCAARPEGNADGVRGADEVCRERV